MSWDRQKSTVAALPEEPSFILWLIVGVVALVAGALLFVLHANHLLGPLQHYNLWLIALVPLFAWLALICFRGWLHNNAFEKHQFEANEAAYAQQQWTQWAGRNIAVLHSGVIFPEFLTPALLLQAPPELEQHTYQALRISLPASENTFSILLVGLSDTLAQIPADLPFGVTLLTDSRDDHASIKKAFAASWQQSVDSQYTVPALTILSSKSFISLDERLKSPTLDIELILIHQTQGQDKYSDALAALLLTSDDVATKYQLTHQACLLRPMPLDIGHMDKELDVFFSTQTQSCVTQYMVGDRAEWGKSFYALLAAGEKHGGDWKIEQTHWLEKYAGISGPFSPWIMAAVASDIVNFAKADCLMLSGDDEQQFINTVTTGNQNEGNR
jgi:hypothetical protein